MNKEIKEILDLLRDTADLSFFAVCGTKEELENMPKCVSKRLSINDEQAKLLLDYITNLQQENEYLKLSNPEMNIEHFRILNENKRKIDNLRKQNKELQQENERLKRLVDKDYTELNIAEMKATNYKSRIDKASDKLGNYKHYSTPTEEQNSENEEIVDSALNILQNGSDSQ